MYIIETRETARHYVVGGVGKFEKSPAISVLHEVNLQDYRIYSSLKKLLASKLSFAPCKVIQECHGFRIPRCRFRIPCLRIPDSTSMDFAFHNQQPGFWITIMAGFRIPLAGFRIPKPWIPDSTRIPQTKITWIPDSGLTYTGQ